jgi:NAD(P)-dependent dehydrogenase (short-subunit alcohol dehydrogenase family)
LIQDKVVIITGSAKGIGRYTAGTFVDAGAKVVIADVDREALQRTEAELKARGGDVLAVETDVRNEDAVKNLVDLTIERFGRVDVLINNAAIVSHSHLWPNPVWGPPWPPVRDMSLDFWNKVFETNVTGIFLCSKHVIPHMERQGGGHIITLTGGGAAEKLGVLTYSLSKATCGQFARYLAEEVRAANICVIAMGPGGTIGTEDAPPEVFAAGYPGVDIVGNRFVIAAEAPMEMTGRSVNVKDGKLEATGQAPPPPRTPVAGSANA